jgi:uncharacterized hydrophobic protein (TIGR00271 family)
MTAVAGGLGDLAGVRHVIVAGNDSGETALVTADVRTDAADAALALLERLDVPADDVVLARVDTIGAESQPLALVWADLLGQARVQARAPGRYFVLMATAGVVGAFAVVNRSSVLLVGAMAISPDLLPITAACTGLVLGRARLARRGLVTLVVGFAATWTLAALVAALLDALGLLPHGFSLGEIAASQTHVNASTILVALSAGVAGMLAVETRASSAVGVAISVTTVPAVAYLGVAAGTGERGHSLSGLAVLTTNVAMMLIGGSAALAVQRVIASRRRVVRADLQGDPPTPRHPGERHGAAS